MTPEEFDALKAEWLKLRYRATASDSYDFYFKNLFPEVERRFLEKIKEQEKEGELPNYSNFIIPMGVEPRYAALMLKALRPKRVFFLSSHEGAKAVDRVVRECGLEPSQYERDSVSYDEMNSLEVYDKIKRKLSLLKEGKTAVDITRGKRVMSAAAAMVGSFFGADLIYIDEAWNLDYGCEDPGQEKLVVVKNPFLIFGDLEQRYAIELFNKHEYEASAGFFRQLCTKSSDPREFEIKALISEAYYHWDLLDYQPALKELSEAAGKIKQYNAITAYTKQVDANVSALKLLKETQGGAKIQEMFRNERLSLELAVDIYCNALRRNEQNRIEDGVAKFYRVIELLSQIEFAKLHIDTGSPEYSQITPETKQKYFQLIDKICRKGEEVPSQLSGFDLPAQISALNGHVLLFVLENRLWKGRTVEELRSLMECSRLRDNSIIAHGLERLSKKAYDSIRKLAESLLKTACSENFELMVRNHSFTRMQ